MDKLLPAFIEHRTAPLLAYLTHPSSLFNPDILTPAVNTVLSRFIMLFAALLTLRLLATAYACIYHPPRAPSPSCAPWSYSGETGPLLWAGLPKQYGCAEDWSACREGRYQSPVVIYTASTDWTPLPPGALDVRIDDVPAGGAELWNLNTTLEVPVIGGVPRGEITVRLPGEREMKYTLLQFHFHTPSEHRIDEEHYPLEMHLVFESQSVPRTLAVIGILFQLTPSPTPADPNPLLTGTFLNLPLISSPHPQTHAPTGALPFTPLLSALHTGSVYTYTGSLTTPPCTENVRWLVLREPQPLGVQTYNAVKAVMKFNARYSQNVPGRENLLEIVRREGGGGRSSMSGSALRVQG